MSAFLRRRLRIVLREGGAEVAGYAHFWARQAYAQELLPGRAMQSGEASWAAGLGALAEWLGTRERLQGAVLDIIVDDSLVRYTLVPWQRELRRRTERMALARACFENAYGDAMQPWDIRIDAVAGNRPAIACAIEHALVTAVKRLCAENKVKLHALQPAFVLKLNSTREAMSTDDIVVLAVDERTIAGACQMAGCWSSVWSRRLPTTHADSMSSDCWPTQLHRECLLRGYSESIPVVLLRNDAVEVLPSFQSLLDIERGNAH
ncbi:hypothetical protein [Sinimarinibacterium flocculans]|uniref:hypothetical protein n=1 Tax=Sinimarinibacterium flocculans TaxID=985250 RepID=UPI0035124D99